MLSKSPRLCVKRRPGPIDRGRTAMLLYSPPKPATSIPVVDLEETFEGGSAARERAADAIGNACRQTGFFYVSNHRVPTSLIDAQFDASKRFFDLPLDVKLA